MKKITLFALLAILFSFAFPLSGIAAQAYPAISFEQWLKKYSAWDQLEKEYAKDKITGDTPEVILKRAQVHLNLNSPKDALEILEMTPAFQNNAFEIRRLWLGGQAQRALGTLSKSVLWFSQATEHMENEKDIRKQFESEPGLETIWMDVWLKLYWAYTANYTISKSTQQEALNRICNIGLAVWGGEYWEKAHGILNPNSLRNATKPSSAPQLDDTELPQSPLVTEADTVTIAKALGSLSLERFDEATAQISSINQPAVQFFWKEVINTIEKGTSPETLSILIDGNHLKATAFWQGNLLAPYSSSPKLWVLGNSDSAPWTKFRNNLLSMPIADAIQAIDNELGSMLISEETSTLLKNFKLALAISNGDIATAKNVWGQIPKRSLPLALKLAGTFLFKENLKNILPDNSAAAFTVYPMISSLCGAAGYDLGSPYEANFWIAAPQDQISELVETKYPLDKLLLLAYWQQTFDSKPTIHFAKRAAFLFDETSLGNEALLMLASDAVRAKKLQLGAFYLNKIDLSAITHQHHGEWLDIKTHLELESGRNAAALKTFNEMHEGGHEIPVITRLRMALLYQQRRNYEAARVQLLAMWDKRSDMTTTLQAETLFWLGEGEQGMRNTEVALDYYLRLAWGYPQENIWALTAMYRASLIYEKRGKYETAKKLLNTVVKRADRKEQREAAQARISAINKKMGKKEKRKTTNNILVYPF